MRDKVAPSFAAAVADVLDGSTLAVGGFGVCGVPFGLIDALVESGVRDLRVVSNNCGTDELGLGRLLEHHQISRMTSSYVGENREFAQQYLSGQLEVELIPQGTLAERLRAGGCGIPAFYTPAGVGTQVAEGGLPWRYAPDGSVAVASPPREVREFHGESYVLEESVRTDFALVRASKGDTMGNLVFHESTRNFNPLCAMAGRVTLVEVEELVPVGTLHPDEVHLPGVFVHCIVQAATSDPKPIERRTVRTRSTAFESGR